MIKLQNARQVRLRKPRSWSRGHKLHHNRCFQTHVHGMNYQNSAKSIQIGKAIGQWIRLRCHARTATSSLVTVRWFAKKMENGIPYQSVKRVSLPAKGTTAVVHSNPFRRKVSCLQMRTGSSELSVNFDDHSSC